jgi:mannosyltransferase
VSGIETGAGEPTSGPVAPDEPARARADAGTGTLTGTAGPGAPKPGSQAPAPAEPAASPASGALPANGASPASGARAGSIGNGSGRPANGQASGTANGRPPVSLPGADTPQATALEPAVPEPAVPGAAVPEAAVPEAAARESAPPEAVAPEAAAREPAAPEAVAPGTAARKPATRQPGAQRPAPSQPGIASRLGVPDWAVHWFVVLAPALAGLVTGGYKLGYPALWRDEATTKIVVGRSVSQIFALLHHTDAVHGAYYLLLHFVVDVIGTSATALRLPSLAAMAIACALIAATTRRLAVMAAAPYADFTGLCAGVAFAVLPFMIRYAQEARSYAIVTMLATVATYCLVRAVSDGRRWWVAYAAAVAACGLFNIFGLLILVPHAVSLLIAGSRERAAVARSAKALAEADTAPAPDTAPAGLPGRRLAGLPARWLIAGGAALVVLAPLAVVAYAQRGVLGWMSRPTFSAVVALAYNSAGSWRLIAPTFTLAVGGVLAGLFIDRSRRPFTPGVVAFPWMVTPPALLIAVSQIHPIYDVRYVEFCLPALAILVAWGIAWLARLTAASPLGRMGLTWLPSTVVVLALLALLVAPDKQIRLNYARPDNLAAASKIVATHAKPGDIIFYIPISGRVVALAYPGAFRNLRDIGLAQSPLASATIYGTDVSPAVLKSRFINVTRVWTISGTGDYEYSGQATPTDKEQVKLISGMHEIDHWWDGDTVLRLYATGPAPTPGS